ncbi:XF1762 family protein [Nonomuraea sp. NPDC052116]|uniref:XF1762 family protein n=1 Tax=Nonomuraea sp. NPDC052116 TaxID=3155665 RepID=UPI003441ADBC
MGADRAVACLFDNGRTLEVTRCATDGTRNTSSVPHSVAWRAARPMGFIRVITCTRADENGTSLKTRRRSWPHLAHRSCNLC